MLIFAHSWTKKLFLKGISKKLLFSRYLRIQAQKLIFSKLSQNNDLFPKYCYLRDMAIWIYGQKKFFKKDLKKTSFFSKCWYLRIHGQKMIFKSDVKKTTFSSIFADSGKKLIFLKLSQNNDLSRNIAIWIYGQKRF